MAVITFFSNLDDSGTVTVRTKDGLEVQLDINLYSRNQLGISVWPIGQAKASLTKIDVTPTNTGQFIYQIEEE